MHVRQIFFTERQTVTTAYLGIIPVVSTTSESLFDAISNFLQGNNIDIHDCIGLGTNGANNVSGEFNSVFSRFREMNPELSSLSAPVTVWPYVQKRHSVLCLVVWNT